MGHDFMGVHFLSDNAGGDSGAGTGDQGGAGAGDQGGQADQSDNTGGSDSTDQTGDKPDKPVKTFTQEELTAISSKEAKKAEAKAREQVLKEMGVSDTKDAKEAIKKHKEYLDSQKTDLEKAQGDYETLKGTHDSVASENNTLKAQVSAMKQSVNPEFVGDVVTLAQTMVSEEVSIDDAIKVVTEKYPHFKGEAKPAEGEEEKKKPSYSTGTHQSNPPVSETEQWMNVFGGK